MLLLRSIVHDEDVTAVVARHDEAQIELADRLLSLRDAALQP
jgi:ABC-type lipoprotein export system ATPase subunit